MKKILFQYLLLLLPVFAVAQNDPPVYKDFITHARELVNSFKLNDHVWVIETRISKESSEITAVDDHMQVLWRTTIDGYSVGAGRFMGHILALSASDYIGMKNRILGPYTAYLIDEKTGKQISKKVFFDRKSDKIEFPSVYFNEDGSNFTFVIRQSKQGTQMFGYATKLSTIEDLTVIKLDDKLNPTISNPKFPDEEFVNMDCNYNGDIFLLTHAKSEKNIKVTKYESQKFESKELITLGMNVHDESDLNDRHGEIFASEEDRNIVYFAVIHRNPEKDDELSVSKINFGDHTAKSVNEPLTRSHIKEIEKAYVPFDKNQDKPDIGPRGLREKYITESNGTLVVVISNQNADIGQYSSSGFVESSLIIKGYDANLASKFQQLMPSFYRSNLYFPLVTHRYNNTLFMLAATGGGNKLVDYYGQLDLVNGNWLKMTQLPKKGMKGVPSPQVMWFADGFIIPYQEFSTFRDDISLQLNSY